MKAKDFPAFEAKCRRSEAEFRFDVFEIELLGSSFDAVLGLLSVSECCLVALGRGCPAVPGETDFWFEDCCC